MPALKLEQFGGMLPAWDPHLLPAGQAANSSNGYLFSGNLQGWRTPTLLRNLTNSAAKFIYRIPTTSSTTATAYAVFLANPANGFSVTVGEGIYKFVITVVNAYDVLIGANAATTASNLLAALTGDNGTYVNRGTVYGNGTSVNSAIGLTGNGTGVANIGGTNYSYLQVVAPDVGAAYNTTPVAYNGVEINWLFNLLSLANTTSTFQGGTNPTFNSSITGPATWLEFLDQDTNVVKSQVVEDTFGRYYFASPSLPPQYNTTPRIVAGKPPFLLGVPAPGCAPNVTVTGGGNSATLPSIVSDNNVDLFQPNTLYLVPITPAGAMQLQDVQFVSPVALACTNYAGLHYAAVVYQDANPNGGVPTTPGTLLGSGIIETGLTTGVNGISPFLNPVPLLAKTPYWIGIMTDTLFDIFEGPNTSTTFIYPNAFSAGPTPVINPGLGTPNSIDFQMWADLSTDDVLEDRAYLYTWISAYGEEGPPSPPTSVTGWSNGVWSIGIYGPPIDDLGVNRNLAILRLYRTVSGQSGSTVYFFVADVSLGSTDPDAINAVIKDALTCQPPTSTYTDVVLDNVIALNLQLPSTNWFAPPENLAGIINLPNGMVAAFKANEIWFCEPYSPHAWPPGYVVATDFSIVGLGMTNGAIVACTAANAYVLNGNAPASMSLVKCAPPDPCLSRGSIVSTDQGVFYMSPNGLALVTNANTSTNTTELWITREKWTQLTPQKYARAIPLVGCYFCFGTTFNGDNSVAQEGFVIQLQQDNTSFTIWPQPGGHRVGFNELSSPLSFNIDNVVIDPWTGIGMLVQNGQVYYYDFTNPAPVMTPYTWQSKIYQQNTKKNYSAMRMFFTVPTGTPAFGTRNTAVASDPSWNTLGPNQYAIIKTFCDIGTDANGVPNGSMICVDAREVQDNGELLRIVSGFKCEQWQWQINGRVVVSNLQVATSAKELGNV
jgi:hypothetical protein